MTCREGHPPRHPDFTEGNQVALKHGAYSGDVLPAAEAILANLLPTLPDYLREARYGPAVRAYAVCLTRLDRVTAWLEAQPVAEGGIPELTADGEVRAAMVLLLRLEREADRHRTGLGLTPLAAARLGRDVTQAQQSITQVLAARQAERERQQAHGHDDERDGS